MTNRMERFTPQARDVLMLSQRECESLQHRTISAAHLLLGMTQATSSLAYRVLHDLNVEYARVLPQVRELLPPETEPGNATAELGPSVKRALEDSVAQARRMGHHYVGTEHLLMGMMERPDDVMQRLLAQLDLSTTTVRRQTVEAMQTAPETAADPPPTSFLPQSEHDRVLKLLEDGKITPSEATDLLNALRVVALPSPFLAAGQPAGFTLAPANILERSARLVLRNRSTGEARSELTIPFEQLQREVALFYNALMQNQTGKRGEWTLGDDVIDVYID